MRIACWSGPRNISTALMRSWSSRKDAAVIDEPGVIRHVEGTRFPIGELDGSNSERSERISNAFIEAGFKSPVLEDIRSEIWLKLWGNLSFNPISALTHATLQDRRYIQSDNPDR